jgi:hypothetical protein
MSEKPDTMCNFLDQFYGRTDEINFIKQMLREAEEPESNPPNRLINFFGVSGSG